MNLRVQNVSRAGYFRVSDSCVMKNNSLHHSMLRVK
jgi:hypothetical protein